MSGYERVLLDLAVFGWGGRTWALPLWPDGQWLADEHRLGVQAIACDPEHRDFQVGGLALLRGRTAFDVEVAEIEAIEAAALRLRHPTTRAWPRGTRLYPVRTARLAEPPQLTRLTDRSAAARARFELLATGDWSPLTDVEVYRGHPVLAARPDEGEALADTWQRPLLTLDHDVGLPFVLDPADWGAPVQTHHWRMHGAAQQATVRSWLSMLRGRQAALWRPTHSDDLTLVTTVAATATALDVVNVGMSRFAGLRPGRRDLRIERRDGAALHRRITAAVGLDEVTERLTLDAPLGEDLRVEDVRRISFLALCRGESDDVEIEHHTDSAGSADCTLVLRAVPDETHDDPAPS